MASNTWSRAQGLVGRSVVIGRRIVAAPEWPVAAGAFLGLLATIEVVLRADGSGSDVRLPTALLLGLGATVPLAFARSHLALAALTIVATSALSLVAYQWLTGAGLVSLLAVLYLLGRQRSRRGKAVERAAFTQSIAATMLEHAARGERARIARDLHDVVAHHISMIAVQAETARLATPGMPADGAKRLLAIGDTARTALTEMRRLLGVLREDAHSEPTRAPQPGLQQLNELLDEARDSAGASTRLIVCGHVAPLDPGVELTAYRIVQEALTNARRHAPGAAVDVELDYADDALHVRIRDNGPGPSHAAPFTRADGTAGAATQGHGLLGMRERAVAVGGDLWTGPAPVSGFLVEAVLPAERLARLAPAPVDATTGMVDQ